MFNKFNNIYKGYIYYLLKNIIFQIYNNFLKIIVAFNQNN